jgi:hypothetical protein
MLLKKISRSILALSILLFLLSFIRDAHSYFVSYEVAHSHFARITGLEKEELIIKRRYADTLDRIRDWYEKRLPPCGTGLQQTEKEKEAATRLQDSLYAVFDKVVAGYKLNNDSFAKNVIPRYETIIRDSIEISFARFRKKYPDKEIVLLQNDSIKKLNLPEKEYKRCDYTKTYLDFLAPH